MRIKDVVSPIDLRNLKDASQWAADVNIKRPWRYAFFDLYASEISHLKIKNPNVLEIGSGPGNLAKVLLENVADIRYTAIDFSEAMHQLSRQHLGVLAPKVTYLVANFKDADWFHIAQQNNYDVVIIHQALHELRHKAYATEFHKQVKQHLLNQEGLYIVTDHIVAENGMKNMDLYMTIDEHFEVLSLAGFHHVHILKEKNALCSFKVFKN